MIEITHNFEARKFKWLWAKYVRGVDEARHCTNAIKGPYSKRFSKLNPNLGAHIIFDEQPLNSFTAIYICGVAGLGYAKHLNYPHNVHLALAPAPGEYDAWSFEGWEVTVRNGRVVPIPSERELPIRCRVLGPEFTTCRIFRWAVCRGSHMVASERSD